MAKARAPLTGLDVRWQHALRSTRDGLVRDDRPGAERQAGSLGWEGLPKQERRVTLRSGPARGEGKRPWLSSGLTAIHVASRHANGRRRLEY